MTSVQLPNLSQSTTAIVPRDRKPTIFIEKVDLYFFWKKKSQSTARMTMVFLISYNYSQIKV
jgi:hypothetical protein